MIRHLLAFLFLSASAWAADLPPAATGNIPELVARDSTRYTKVTVTKREPGRVSFSHSDGITTLPLTAFDDHNLERLFPGHLALLKAKQAAAEKKEQERERDRDAQRKKSLEQDPAAAARARKEDDIREAAIRFALSHYEIPDLTQVSVILLEIDHDTPSDEFLERLAKHQPPVRKRPRLRGELKATDLSCEISNLKWLSETEAEINASRMFGDGAVSFCYTVRFGNKGWQIVQYRITGIV